MAVSEIEAQLPVSAIPTTYTAFVHYHGGNLIADYDQVVAYADGNEVRRKFPRRRGQPNLLILEPDPLLPRYGTVAPRCQVYVDLFSLPTWQAQRFRKALDHEVVEVLINHSEQIDHARVLTAEAQFVAKMAALLDRPDTLPGEKDRHEMWELINSGGGLDFKPWLKSCSREGGMAHAKLNCLTGPSTFSGKRPV